jgi:hypothetical protein
MVLSGHSTKSLTVSIITVVSRAIMPHGNNSRVIFATSALSFLMALYVSLDADWHEQKKNKINGMYLIN